MTACQDPCTWDSCTDVLEALMYYSRRAQSNISTEGRGVVHTWGNWTRASETGPLRAVRRNVLNPVARSCDNTYAMLSPRKTQRLSTWAFLLGGVRVGTRPTWHVPGFQTPSRKAGVRPKPYYLCKELKHRVSLLFRKYWNSPQW